MRPRQANEETLESFLRRKLQPGGENALRQAHLPHRNRFQ
jgi:hypothetical protein